MVIVSYKMKYAVNHHPVQFIVELSSVLNRILPDGIDTYEKISGKFLTLAVIEGDDIGEIVVTEKPLIYVKYVIIRTEYNINVSQRSDFTLCNKFQPLVVFCFPFKQKVGFFEEIRYHGGLILHKFTTNKSKSLITNKIISIFENILEEVTMEVKKSDKANLEKKKLLFFEIGMVIALLIVYIAFEWTTRETNYDTLVDTTQMIDEEEIINIDQNTPPPPPPAAEIPVLSDQIDIVDDDIKVDDMIINTEDDANTGVEIQDYVAEVQEEVVEEEAIPFQLVEVQPSFNGGGPNEFTKWVNQRLVYPEIAKENGVQGRVTLQFTVEKDGSVTNVKVLRGVDSSLDKEAVRVVSSSPKWKPGKQRDRAVKVTYTFPVIFQLR